MDNLGDRMKGYEDVSRLYLMKRMPVIIRIDGKAFHSFTRGFSKPFDILLMRTMQETSAALCKEIMNCKLAYTQSDEISLLLIDYEKLDTQPWFEKNLQKMVSVAASIATAAFNEQFFKNMLDYGEVGVYEKKTFRAMFDARAFVIPKEEVCNYFIWRQQDASKNSVQMLARSLFSHKELGNKSCDEMQEMMWSAHNVNWNNLPTTQKRGCCIVKEYYDKDGTTRSRWSVDQETPIFTKDREYIEKYVNVGE